MTIDVPAKHPAVGEPIDLEGKMTYQAAEGLDVANLVATKEISFSHLYKVICCTSDALFSQMPLYLGQGTKYEHINTTSHNKHFQNSEKKITSHAQ